MSKPFAGGHHGLTGVPRPTRVLAYGEALIDLILSPAGLTWHLGGAPANVAVAAARLGAPAGLVASVGDDFFGAFIAARLREYEVDCRGLTAVSREPTSLALILLDERGQQSDFVFYRHADLLIESAQVAAACADPAGILCFGSLSLTAAPARDTLEEVIGQYRRRGGTAVFDINFRPALWPGTDAWAEAVRGLLPWCQVVKANLAEARALSGRDDPAAAASHLWSEEQRLLIVTLGEDGCYYQTRRGSGFVPGFRVEAGKGDAVGAGDAFTGALCSGLAAAADRERLLSQPSEIEEVLRRANAAGAVTAAAAGAIAPEFSLGVLETLMRQS